MIKKLSFILVLASLVGCGTSKDENSKTKEKASALLNTVQTKTDIDPMTPQGVTDLMKLTSRWQIDNLSNVMHIPDGIIEPLTTHNWVRATFLSGMMAYYDLTKEEGILNYVDSLCAEVNYELGERERHADEFAIGRVYTDLFLVKQDKQILKDTYARVDHMIENPSRGPIVGWDLDKNWSWCDALFMAPPTWLKLYTCSGKRIYLHEMDLRFWDTYDYLYSKEDSLFYRDDRFKWDKPYADRMKSENGHKIFWGRGNGWVCGSLIDILTYIPGDYHHRPQYKQLYMEMMDRLLALQAEDGLWRSSLLDYDQFPTKEFSASAFFCYAMAWGVNNKYLDREKYGPAVEKSWKGLVECIHEDGKIGYVQKVGASPFSLGSDDTMEYGCGAFLLAGKQMHRFLGQ